MIGTGPYRVRDSCMLCDGSLKTVWEFRPTPLANSYRTDLEPPEYFPLELARCVSCHHFQCPIVVDPNVLFEDYAYVSGTSPSFVKHFHHYAQNLTERFFLTPSSLVVEFGSNDGTMLKEFDCRILGVDPSKNVSAIANESGVETICAFFEPILAQSILHERGYADLIVANNVMAHAEDLKSILRAVKILLDPNGAFVFEISYGLNVLEKNLFDTVYHEHLHYHTVTALKKFVEANGMTLFDVEHVNTHGGSIRCFVSFPSSHREESNVTAALLMEESSGILDARLRDIVHRNRNIQSSVSSDLYYLQRERRIKNIRVFGYGAPAKSVTLLTELTTPLEMFDAIVDDNPLKQGKFHPSHNCPIISYDEMMKNPPDVVVILAWNFTEQILAKLPSTVRTVVLQLNPPENAQ